MSSFLDDDDDTPPGFFQKFRVPIIIGTLIVVGAGVWFVLPKDDRPKRKSSMSMVNIMPPPPPPPTPPPTPPPPQPETPPEETQDRPEFVEETQPDSPPEPDTAPPEEAAPMGSNIQGDGSDSFGLRGKGGGGMIGGLGSGNRQGGGSKFGYYAGKVQSRVAEALRSHKKTRSATMNVKVRVWADSTGRITRATIEGSTGKPDIDRAITDEILSGLQLPEPPPEDMPMPIVMRLSAKRPN